MPHPTKREMIDGWPALAAHADRLEQALHDTLAGQVTWSGWHAVPDRAGKYRAGICRTDVQPILLLTFRVPGQSDSTSVKDLESYEARMRDLHTESALTILDAISDAQAKVAGLKRDQDAGLTVEV